MSSSPFRLRTLAAVGGVAALVTVAACSSSGTSASGSSSSNSNSGTMTVAVVSNPLITGQMIPLTSSDFEKQYPGIKVKFATYTEGDLRAAIEKDVSHAQQRVQRHHDRPVRGAAVRQERLADQPVHAVHRE